MSNYEYYRKVVKDSNTLVITFASAGGPSCVPKPFAMRGVLSNIQVDQLYLRDELRWYLCGTGPHKTLADYAVWLQGQTKRYKHVHMTGQSMGGWGALLSSMLIANCHSVVAYAPQTCLHRATLESWHDAGRWKFALDRIKNTQEHAYLDLSKVTPAGDLCTRFVVFPRYMAADRIHADNLQHLSKYCTFSFPQKTHGNFGRKMRDTGIMGRVLQALAAGGPLGGTRRIREALKVEEHLELEYEST